MSEQRSEEWFRERAGKATASRIADITARTKSGYSASRANYRSQLVIERLQGKPVESYINAAMQFGIDTEPQARAAYEFLHDVDVETCGFFTHPAIPMSGASPDGLVGAEGLLEIKCPNSATYINAALGDEIDDRYMKQMQWQLACSCRQWCDFVLFDPRMPPDMQFDCQRVMRDESMIADLEREVVIFLREVDETLAALIAKFRTKEAAE